MCVGVAGWRLGSGFCTLCCGSHGVLSTMHICMRNVGFRVMMRVGRPVALSTKSFCLLFLILLYWPPTLPTSKFGSFLRRNGHYCTSWTWLIQLPWLVTFLGHEIILSCHERCEKYSYA